MPGEKFANKVHLENKQTPKWAGNTKGKLADSATKDEGKTHTSSLEHMDTEG